VRPLFETLDWLETRLANQRFLLGDVVTEADLRLFTTLVRFDPVYARHFKCNLRRLVDHPHLWALHARRVPAPRRGGDVDFEHIKRHYYESNRGFNPTGIVPVGPVLDFPAPHGRKSLGGGR
jgi:putative glutathione S-transferase